MLRPVSWVADVYLTTTAGMRVGDLSLLPPQETTDELQGDGWPACCLENRGRPTKMSSRSSENSLCTKLPANINSLILH